MVPPVPLGCHAQGLTVNVGPPSSAYQKQGRSLAQLNIDRWNWVQELQDAKEVKAVKIATDRNIADLLTKCHSRRTYEHLIGLALEKAKEYASIAVASNLAI